MQDEPVASFNMAMNYHDFKLIKKAIDSPEFAGLEIKVNLIPDTLNSVELQSAIRGILVDILHAISKYRVM